MIQKSEKYIELYGAYGDIVYNKEDIDKENKYRITKVSITNQNICYKMWKEPYSKLPISINHKDFKTKILNKNNNKELFKLELKALINEKIIYYPLGKSYKELNEECIIIKIIQSREGIQYYLKNKNKKEYLVTPENFDEKIDI